MTLFAAELRKLLSPRLLLIAVALSALYGHVFLVPSLEQLSTSHPFLEIHQLTVRAAEQFGDEISPTEYKEWEQQYRSLEQRADARIAGDPALRKLEISTWQQLSDVTDSDDAPRAEHARMAAAPLFYDVSAGHAGLGFTLESFTSLLDDYRGVQQHGLAALPHSTAADRQHSRSILASGSWRAIQDQGLLQAIADYTRELAILVVLVVLLITAPLPVTDTVRRMRALQYSSRRGRAVFTAQFAATLAAGLFGGLLACIVAGLSFAASQVGPFLNNSVWSYAAFMSYRSDATLVADLLGSAVIVLLLAVTAGGIAFVLARWSSHYTGLLVRLVIAFAALVTLTTNVLGMPFTFANPLWQLARLPGVELVASCVCAAVAITLCIVVVRREHSHDMS